MVKAAAASTASGSRGHGVASSGKQLKKKKVAKLDPVHKVALKWVTEHLSEHPDTLLLVKAHLESGHVFSKSAKDDGYVHCTYQSFKQIRKEFLAECSVEVSSSYGMNAEVVDSIDAKCR